MSVFTASDEKTLNECDPFGLVQAIKRLHLAANLFKSTTVYDHNSSICDLLQDHIVSTEKEQFGPGPPRSVAALGPFHLVNKTLAVAYAKGKIKLESTCKKQKVKELEDSDSDLSVFSDKEEEINECNNKWTPKDYLHTRQIIQKFHEKFPTADVNFIQDFVGFCLLGMRMDKLSMINPVEEKCIKRIITYGFKSCNDTYRLNDNHGLLKAELEKYRSLKLFEKFKPNKQKKYHTLEKDPPENTTQPESFTLGNPFQYLPPSPMPVEKEKQRTCCICSRTNTKFPGTKYFNVPRGPTVNNISLFTLSYKRRNYYVSEYTKKEYLKRLQLPKDKVNRKCLLVCEMHAMVSEVHQIPWKDIDGSTKIHKKELLMPIISDTQQKVTRSVTEPMFCSYVDRTKVIRTQKNNIQQPANMSDGTKKPPVAYTMCMFPCCRNKSTDVIDASKIVLHRIPPPPMTTNKDGTNYKPTNKYKKKFAIRTKLRRECLLRLGLDINDDRSHIRICNQHKVEKITRQVVWENISGEPKKELVRLFVPESFGVESNLNVSSKKRKRDNGGVGAARVTKRTVEIVEDKIKEGDETAEWCWEITQFMNQIEWEKEMDEVQEKQKSHFGYQHVGKHQVASEKEETVLGIHNSTNKYIKETTGFSSKMHMLSYICVITRGNLLNIFNTTSHMSWYEEWIFFFQMLYGRCYRRWVDATNHFKKDNRILRRIFDHKLHLQIETRQNWPRYVSIEEDEEMRDIRWNETYNGKRVIMWDNTSLPTKKPSDPELQRNTFSAYYAGNVAKGAVFVQLC